MTCFAAPVLLPTTTINTLIVTMMTGMRQEQRKRTLTESFERGIVEEVDLSVAPSDGGLVQVPVLSLVKIW